MLWASCLIPEVGRKVICAVGASKTASGSFCWNFPSSTIHCDCCGSVCIVEKGLMSQIDEKQDTITVMRSRKITFLSLGKASAAAAIKGLMAIMSSSIKALMAPWICTGTPSWTPTTIRNGRIGAMPTDTTRSGRTEREPCLQTQYYQKRQNGSHACRHNTIRNGRMRSMPVDTTPSGTAAWEPSLVYFPTLEDERKVICKDNLLLLFQ